MKKFKVLHVSSALSWRGGEQQIVNLIDGLTLINENIDQMIFCARESAIEKYSISCQINFESAKKKSAIDLFYLSALSRVIKSYQPDIIHVHDSHAHTACVLVHLFIFSKIPIVLHRRVDFSTGKSFFSNYKYNYSGIKRIITVSKAIKKIIEPNVKAPINVIYSSWRKSLIDESKVINLREELKLPNSTKLIGNIAALTDHKDYQTFVKTAALIIKKDLNIHFIITGDGELKEQIESLIRSLNLEKNIHLLGFREDVPEIMKNLDIFFMPSKMEGLGSILYLAFGFKIPVVSTNAGGIPELVKDKETGYTCGIGNSQELSQRLIMVLEQENSSITESAYQLALSNLHVDMAQANHNIYLDLIRNNYEI